MDDRDAADGKMHENALLVGNRQKQNSEEKSYVTGLVMGLEGLVQVPKHTTGRTHEECACHDECACTFTCTCTFFVHVRI
jgi:hypothetical protein